MYDAIVPAQCQLYYVTEEKRLEVKLKKKNGEIHWRTFKDETVC